MQDLTFGDALKIIERQAVLISKLETPDGNTLKRAEVGDETPRPPQSRHGSAHPDPESRYEDADLLALKYAQTLHLYNKLQTEHATCQRKVERAAAKAKEYKAYARRWHDYLKQRFPELFGAGSAPIDNGYQHRARLRELLIEAPTSSVNVTSTTALSAQDIDPHQPPNLERIADVAIQSAEEHEDLMLHSTPVKLPVASSQTTQSEDMAGSASWRTRMKTESSSDGEPVVISARSLKRKHDDMSPVRAVRIKSELNRSGQPIELVSEDGPSAQSISRTAFQPETSDLDRIFMPTRTPRRMRRYSSTLEYRTTSINNLDMDEAQISNSGCLAGDLDDTTSVDGQTGLASRMPLLDQVKSHLRASQAGREPSVLQPMSPNISRASPGQSSWERRPSAVKRKVAGLSEDGENLNSTSRRPPTVSSRPSAPPMSKCERLDTIMLGPEAATPLPSLLARSRPIKSSSNAEEQAPDIKPVSTLKWRPPLHLQRSLSDSDGTMPLPQPEEEPLRQRPMTALRLEDFRVNPTYLGISFASADKVLGRDQRKHLHVCTRADCCGGALRKVIELGGTAMSGKTDAQALAAYLGPGWADIVGGYEARRRTEVVMQAHAWAFANKHGRHRQAFERPSSPPGFWRLSMPTTQEVVENRRRAAEMERAKVEERWREAMREGGRWKFRDE